MIFPGARLDRLSRAAALERLAFVPLVLLSALVGYLLNERPMLAALPLALLVGALLLVDGRARLLFVLFGGLLVLQRSSGLDASKLALLAGVVIAYVGALANTRRLRGTRAYEVVAPLATASAVFAALGLFSLVVAYSRGTPLADSVRDATPYLLFATAPVFALDAQASLSTRALVRLLVAAGTLGAASFAVAWLQRRGIAYLPLARLGVASVYLPAALFSLAMSHLLQANARRPRWLVVAAVVLALLVATGTRTTLVLLVAPLAIVVATRRRRAMRSFRLALFAPLAAAITVLLTVAVVALTNADTSFLDKRIAIFRASGQSESDASFNDRVEQGRVAWAAFTSSPAFGVGPGHAFEWREQGTPELQTGFVLDTPLSFPAKFGIGGLIVLLFVVAGLWSSLRAVARLAPGIPYLALAGYLAVVAALAIFAPPFEDKGFSYGLLIVLAIALASIREPPRGEALRPQALKQA
jgi:O-antigen ligase